MNTSGYFYYITLTKHKKLNLAQTPCEEDLGYNFTVCIKENLSQIVGCRLPRDKWSQQYRNVCTTKKQFDEFDQMYGTLTNANANKIVELTGCRMPCNYKEYKFVESSSNSFSQPSVLAFLAQSCEMSIFLHRANLSNQNLPHEKRVNSNKFSS